MPVLYDHREVRSTVPGLLALEGLELEAAQLAVGDYLLSDRLAVERKTGTDLVASIKDRRLWEQVDRLKEAYPAVVLIVEGKPTRFPEAGWKGALGSVLAAGGVSVLQTADPEETADWIARLARREAKPPSGPRGAVRKSKDLLGQREGVLLTLPGVSRVGARRLLEHFGTLAAVFAATEQQLREVEGFGAKRAEALAALFAGDSSRSWN